ncbi:MAG: site-specific integrase [Oscillospiraceae bacterium]|nr:site-specific integrase [Oscillospiraceae bacterium]
MTADSVDAVELTEGLIEEYLETLASCGRNQETVKTYCRCLRELRRFLLREDMPLTMEAVALWQNSLEQSDLSVSSVNVRMSAANGLMEYSGVLKTALPMLQSK